MRMRPDFRYGPVSQREVDEYKEREEAYDRALREANRILDRARDGQLMHPKWVIWALRTTGDKTGPANDDR